MLALVESLNGYNLLRNDQGCWVADILYINDTAIFNYLASQIADISGEWSWLDQKLADASPLQAQPRLPLKGTFWA